MDPQHILVDNLKVALERVQRFMVVGIAASLFNLLLVIEVSDLLQTGTKVKLPGGLLETKPGVAVIVVMTAYWIAGLLAVDGVGRATSIVRELRKSPEILLATLTYPSLATTRLTLLRVGAVLLPPFLLVVAITFEKSWQSSVNFWSGFTLFILPYVILAFQLRWPVGGRTARVSGG